MTKMAVYLEANVILGSSLSPNNYCICKITALNNGADSAKIQAIVPNATNNRLVPVSALQAQTTTYTIVFKDWDGTVISTQYVVQGGTVTKPTDPTRAGYTFADWSPTFSPIATSNVTYTATYTLSGSGTQYKIIFADKKVAASGIYIYMNDGSIVPISQKDTVSKTNAVGIAYISGNLKALIDTKNSQAVEFGRANDYPRGSLSTGLEYTNFLRNNEDPQSPLPVLTWCDSRFNGEGYIPTIREWLQIAEYASQINTAMEWFGGDTFVTESSHPYQTYWSSNLYSENRVSDLEFNAIGSDDNWHTVPIELISNIHDQHYVRVLKNIDVPTPYRAEGIYQTMYVNAGVTPNPNTPTKEGYLFERWNPNLYPADKDETYYAMWSEGSSESGTGGGNIGTYGFGTDSDGESKGQFLRIDGEGTYNYGTVVLDVTLKKYVNESVQSTTTGTITLNNWSSSMLPSITISQSLLGAGLVNLGTTTQTGQAIAEIGSSDSAYDPDTRVTCPPRGVHYVMDISTSNNITYTSAHRVSIEGKNIVNYYHRLYIPEI